MAHFSQAAFRAHMAFLADDLLEGRGTATRGHELGARYVAAQFEAAGLKPAGDGGSFFQRVPLREVRVKQEDCRLELTRGGKGVPLAWGSDFVMNGNPLVQESSVEAPVVFVGHGVTTPDGAYDDYRGVDVRGKVVAFLPDAPPSLAPPMISHVTAEKVANAAAHGAVGILRLTPPDAEAAFPWSRVVASVGFPLMRWLGPDRQPNNSFPALKGNAILSLAATQSLFSGAAKSWAEVWRDAKASRPQAFQLPVSVSMRVVSSHRDVSSPNVVGVLPGSDPALGQDYVLYTAHADHLGIGKPVNGDSIYNGAADDASGVAALIELAGAFRSLPRPPRRSIMFLATTAEEKGHLGSDYFASNPPVDPSRIVADVNIDGASLFYTFDDVIAYGGEDSSLGEVVRGAAARMGLQLSPDPEPEQHYFTRSDQYSFVRKGIPSVFVVEGYKAKDRSFDAKKFSDAWTARNYHSPTDDMNQPFKLEAAIEFMQLDFLIGYQLAQARERPRWRAGDFFGRTFGPDRMEVPVAGPPLSR